MRVATFGLWLGAVGLAGDARAEDPPPPAAVEPAPEPPPGDTAPDELPIVRMPEIVEYVEAPYPAEAEAQRLEGTVGLLVTLDEAGAVIDVVIARPAGHGFDEAAIDAVRRMKFTPAMTEAGPVAVQFEFEYGFVLRPEAPPPEVEAPPPVNVEGTITEMGTRRPVEGARVAVAGTDLVAVTDAEGRFALRGVPVGAVLLRVVSPGHVPLERPIDVVEGEVTVARLWIRAEEYREHEAVGVYRVEEEEVTRRTLTIEEVKRVPGTFGDPVKVVQTLPGAARSPFGTGFLIIRGSNPEDSGVYIDGVRIPIIYHLTGTTSVLSPELIEAVDYLPGGFGVQYGRSMGGVVDIRSKTKFDDGKLVWGTDILDSQVYYEGNLGKNDQHGVAVGARRSYIDVLLPLFVSDGFVIKPRYWDYQVKWAPKGTDDRRFSAFVYGFNDVLSVSTPDDFAQGTDQDAQGNLYTEYSSHRIVLRWHQAITDTLAFEVTPSVGVDYADFGLGNELSLRNTNWLGEVRAELPWRPSDAVEVVPGVDFIGGLWSFEFTSPFRWEDLDDPLEERESVALDGHGTGWGPDLYLKANLRPLEDRDRLLLVPGVRYNIVTLTYNGSITGEGATDPWTITSVDPRLTGRFEVVDRVFLKGGSGLYHEPPQPHESVGIGTSVDLDFERSWSSDLGFEHHLTPAVSYDVDFFYKDMSRLVVFNEAWGGYGDQAFLNAGEGRAYGVELILRHAKVDRFFGWISYTYSRSIRKDAPDDDWYPFDYDQPHIFSAQGGYDLPRDFAVSAQVQYVSGNPDSAYDASVCDLDALWCNPFEDGQYHGERLPPYVQASVRFDRLWTFKRWQLATYVDLMNVVRGVNPEFTVYNYDYTEHAYVRGLPFIPNVGVEARFHL